jgi:hypothetical protein
LLHGLGTGGLAIFSLLRCLWGGVVIKILNNQQGPAAPASAPQIQTQIFLYVPISKILAKRGGESGSKIGHILICLAPVRDSGSFVLNLGIVSECVLVVSVRLFVSFVLLFLLLVNSCREE